MAAVLANRLRQLRRLDYLVQQPRVRRLDPDHRHVARRIEPGLLDLASLRPRCGKQGEWRLPSCRTAFGCGWQQHVFSAPRPDELERAPEVWVRPSMLARDA